MTRFDVLCQPHLEDTVQGLLGRWAEDRALRDDARTVLRCLVGAAVGHGLRFDPRGLVVLIRWLDPERVRIELRWLDCSSTASPDWDRHDVEATIATLDALAADWGVGRSERGWIHWMVADTG